MPTTSQGHPQLLIDENGRPREECGVFGIIGPENAASLTVFGLYALQHRGQEACGILTFEGTNEQEVPKIRSARGMVSHVFGNRHKLKAMSGNIAVGHVRYATKGPKNDVNAIQPFYTINKSGSFGLAHNGQFTNSLAIRKTAMERNYSFRSNSDSETVVGAISISHKPSLLECIQEGISHMRGAFALVIATPYQLIGIRDPNGIRPLVLGKLRDGNGFVLASESCALDIIDAELVRDIVPGEMIIINKHGHKSHFNCGENARARTCIFEYVYFSRPDSILDGRHIYQARYNMGLQMAEQELAKRTDGLQGDVVISVPDSGNPAALGFAKGLGLDYQMGVIRNHYIGRSFIEPTQHKREEKVRLKHSPNRA
ncbi:MAG: amidophosphoribosyltransferase, partial [Alphaproteobacteria bacterium]|nr:amidophosphoribosyltransferase [Alphaproteobacteria bacterium]